MTGHLHAAPAAPLPNGSIEGWLLVLLALAVVAAWCLTLLISHR